MIHIKALFPTAYIVISTHRTLYFKHRTIWGSSAELKLCTIWNTLQIKNPHAVLEQTYILLAKCWLNIMEICLIVPIIFRLAMPCQEISRCIVVWQENSGQDMKALTSSEHKESQSGHALSCLLKTDTYFIWWQKVGFTTNRRTTLWELLSNI